MVARRNCELANPAQVRQIASQTRSTSLRRMRFVAGQGAEAERHREAVAGQGAVAERHREDVAGRGAVAAEMLLSRTLLTEKSKAASRSCCWQVRLNGPLLL